MARRDGCCGLAWCSQIADCTMTREQVEADFARMQEQLGVAIEVLYCPHPAVRRRAGVASRCPGWASCSSITASIRHSVSMSGSVRRTQASHAGLDSNAETRTTDRRRNRDLSLRRQFRMTEDHEMHITAVMQDGRSVPDV